MKRLPHIVPTVPQRPSSLRRLRKLFCGAAAELSQERRNEERVPWDDWYDAVGRLDFGQKVRYGRNRIDQRRFGGALRQCALWGIGSPNRVIVASAGSSRRL
jgi:hypothetical protein